MSAREFGRGFRGGAGPARGGWVSRPALAMVGSVVLLVLLVLSLKAPRPQPPVSSRTGVGGGSAADSSTGSPTSSSSSSSSAVDATESNSSSANSPSARSGERTAGASKQAAADSNSNEPLTVYVAASNKAVFEAIRKEYERQYGQTLEVQFGASQTMLAALEVSKSGDLYLPADNSFLKVAEQRRLLLSAPYPLARMTAVLTVAKGNPKGIREWKDLLRDDVKLAQASDEATAIGKLTRKTLEASGQWETLKARTAVFKTTVNEVANDVKVGAADVGIVFDAVLHDYPTLDAVAIEELKPVMADIGVAVLKSSKSPARAAHFARFLAARDKGLEKYAEFGFKPVDGDPWSERPELTLYSGSMLRPAIEATITQFEQREGVQVTRVYNGCGILVAQMKAGQVPDAYFACDVEFMTQVKEMFPESQGIAQNELVILVKKGNPHKIASLRDLAKEGLRVGIGHEKQCAMGWLTQKTFAEGGIRDEVMKNVVVQTPTGDMLVNQMRSGSLDAAVAYLSNAAGAAGQLDAVRIRGLPCAIATQPYGVAKDSPHKQLAARLRSAIETEESRERFRSEGFNWVGDKAAARD